MSTPLTKLTKPLNVANCYLTQFKKDTTELSMSTQEIIPINISTIDRSSKQDLNPGIVDVETSAVTTRLQRRTHEGCTTPDIF